MLLTLTTYTEIGSMCNFSAADIKVRSIPTMTKKDVEELPQLTDSQFDELLRKKVLQFLEEFEWRKSKGLVGGVINEEDRQLLFMAREIRRRNQ